MKLLIRCPPTTFHKSVNVPRKSSVFLSASRSAILRPVCVFDGLSIDYLCSFSPSVGERGDKTDLGQGARHPWDGAGPSGRRPRLWPPLPSPRGTAPPGGGSTAPPAAASSLSPRPGPRPPPFGLSRTPVRVGRYRRAFVKEGTPLCEGGAPNNLSSSPGPGCHPAASAVPPLPIDRPQFTWDFTGGGEGLSQLPFF